MGETSAKSMRGSGMEDVIFSGTSNKPSKNIAEVVIALSNKNKEGPHQYKDLEKVEIKRKVVVTNCANLSDIYLLENEHVINPIKGKKTIKEIILTF